MKKILLASSAFFLVLTALPFGTFAAETNAITGIKSPIVSTKKIRDITPLTPAEARALTAKLNKEHNEKAFDKKFNARARAAAAKHAKLVKKKIPVKKAVTKKQVVKSKK